MNELLQTPKNWLLLISVVLLYHFLPYMFIIHSVSYKKYVGNLYITKILSSIQNLLRLRRNGINYVDFE